MQRVTWLLVNVLGAAESAPVLPKRNMQRQQAATILNSHRED